MNSQNKYQKDFDYLWNLLNDYYAYFDQKQTDWQEVKKIYQPRVDSVSQDRQFIKLVEDVIYELYDAHTSINRNLNTSYRLIPSSTDAWIKYKNGKYYIIDIRPNFETEKKGLKIGSELICINDENIEDLVTNILPKSFDNPKDNVREFFANLLFAGKHNAKRNILVNLNGEEILFKLDKPKSLLKPKGLFFSEILNNNIGYIKINNSLGNNEMIKAFPQKVDELKNTKAIILDLRETSNGGNTEVAKAIMGKFITETIPYQKHERVSLEREFGIKRSWIELLSPLEKPYKKPIVVLVGRWTGSVGEAIAQGFSTIKTARVVGTEMAKLLGAIQCDRLPNTGINLCFPNDKLFHIDGTPREDFTPKNETKNSRETYLKALELVK